MSIKEPYFCLKLHLYIKGYVSMTFKRVSEGRVTLYFNAVIGVSGGKNEYCNLNKQTGTLSDLTRHAQWL